MLYFLSLALSRAYWSQLYSHYSSYYFSLHDMTWHDMTTCLNCTVMGDSFWYVNIWKKKYWHYLCVFEFYWHGFIKIGLSEFISFFVFQWRDTCVLECYHHDCFFYCIVLAWLFFYSNLMLKSAFPSDITFNCSSFILAIRQIKCHCSYWDGLL